MLNDKHLHIGFVSTRLEGTDGVSLEAFKWAEALAYLGHECFYFAGACDREVKRSRVVPEAHFKHELVDQINLDLFDNCRRSPSTTEAVHDMRRALEDALREFVKDFEIDVLIAENALSLPVNVPLGLALSSLIAETEIPTVAHHHDFAWERPRYSIHAAADYLQAAFPPVMPGIYNVVINSVAATQLARRTGMRSTIIPNVMDFDTPPPEPDSYARSLRHELGVSDHQQLLLQPTRIVPRKRIERSIELLCRLELPCRLVVTHGSGDEGHEYQAYLEDVARRLQVEVTFAAEQFNHHRAKTAQGKPIYALSDAYQQADLVTYPSAVEGFGNAFVEAIYYGRSIVMSSYDIFTTDIKPKGFQVIEFGEFTSEKTLAAVRDALQNPSRMESMTQRNYELGKRYFSYTSLRQRLQLLLDHLLGNLY